MAINPRYKIVFIGDASVGKTSLFHRFATGTFTTDYKATLGADQKTISARVQDQAVSFEIWDTAGQERFRAMTTSCYRNSSGFIIVYDISKKETFTNLDGWVNELKSYKCDHLPIILVGNKVDHDNKEVDTQEANNFATSKKYAFTEVSAKLGTNCDEILQKLGGMLLDSHQINNNNTTFRSTNVNTRQTLTNDNDNQSICC
eukprot:TRINITY_DN1252_c0_g1_i7.p1 TRINITY_DN1252_c0_g1~~TRINITY_DN1252_c0_g1_i7.p1  ORF type:complete len:202 (+),score=83.42 TRINITY_DN1252_c0_g1_i7:157-762(+)